jgi:hypothetical protein
MGKEKPSAPGTSSLWEQKSRGRYRPSEAETQQKIESDKEDRQLGLAEKQKQHEARWAADELKEWQAEETNPHGEKGWFWQKPKPKSESQIQTKIKINEGENNSTHE